MMIDLILTAFLMNFPNRAENGIQLIQLIFRRPFNISSAHQEQHLDVV